MTSLGVKGKNYNETKLIEEAVQNMAIQFMQAYIVGCSNFSGFSFSVDTMDTLIKNFICYFPDKVKKRSEEKLILTILQGLECFSSYFSRLKDVFKPFLRSKVVFKSFLRFRILFKLFSRA